MFIYLITFVWLAAEALSACDRGCISCTSNSVCALCDATSGYFILNSACVYSPLANCTLPSANSTCLQCQSPLFPDPATGRCAPTELSSRVANCTLYGPQQACLRCDKNLFLGNGTCRAVSSKVDHCELYSEDGKCSGCASGFVLNPKTGSCASQPLLAGCVQFSFLECRQCAAGYVLNQNLYLSQLGLSPGLLYIELVGRSLGLGQTVGPVNQCQKVFDTNCLVPQSDGGCLSCKSGFFLSGGSQCLQFPPPQLQGCSSYKSLTECLRCSDGFHMTNTSVCEPIAQKDLIADCAQYDPTSISIVCTQCTNDKLLANNMCSAARNSSLSISNCDSLSPSSETCALCRKDFVLTSDNKNCLASLPNCAEYASSSESNTILLCKTCQPGFFLQDNGEQNGCFQGQIKGCLTYSSPSSCASCNATAFYLKDATCLRHVAVANCSAYSQSVPNQCDVCAAGFYPFKLSRVCSATSALSFCTAYRAPGVCSACLDGYEFKDGACSLIILPTNCKTINQASKCTECKEGFALLDNDGDFSCVPWHEYIVQNCQELNTPLTVNFADQADSSCEVCKQNTMTIDLGGKAVCIADSLLYTRGVNANTEIPGCRRYLYDSESGLLCQQCKGSQRLQMDSDFIQACDVCEEGSTFVFENVDGFYNVCATPDSSLAIKDCLYAVQVPDSEGFTTKCIGASSDVGNLVASLNPSDSVYFWKEVIPSTIPKPQFGLLFFGYEATSPGIGSNIHDRGSDQTACEFFFVVTEATFACLRCKWGYASTIVTTFNGEIDIITGSSCSVISGCDTTVSYWGFPAKYAQLLSCHKCLGGLQLLLKISGIVSTSFSISGLVNNAPSVQCVPATSGDLYRDESGSTIANCLVHLNLPLNKGCAACQPGYKYALATASIQTSCVAIENCDLTSKYNVQANRCGKCASVFDREGIQTYYAAETSLLTSCVSVSTDNCLVADTAGQSAGQTNCKACFPGYWLNADFICEQILFAKCLDSGVEGFVPDFTNSDKVGIYYMLKNLSQKDFLNGCNECQSGYTAFILPKNERQCLTSSYVNSVTLQGSKNYINGCLRYNNFINTNSDPYVTCVLCNSAKTLRDDGKSCVSLIPDCDRAQVEDSTKCLTCAETHFNINGQCILKSIPNCVTYEDSNASSPDQRCATCADEFYLTSTKTCLPGKIARCKTYGQNAPDVCLECLAGYGKVNTVTGSGYCIRLDNGLCTAVDDGEGLQQGLYRCIKCNFPANQGVWLQEFSSIPLQSSLPQSVCLGLQPVENCAQYDASKPLPAQNSFDCVECLSGFYYNQTLKSCANRTNISPHCLIYYPSKDLCQTCDALSFKSQNETTCTVFPSGIEGCATYVNATVCASCFPPRFLVNNTCPIGRTISRCRLYDAEFSCLQCESGFYLLNSTACAPSQATNCYVNKAFNACEQCDPNNLNMGLINDTSGFVNCVQKNVPNCELTTGQFPFKCLQCAAGYFLTSTGICLEVQPIANCALMQTPTTCKRCTVGFVLSENLTSCADRFYQNSSDPFCVDSRMLDVPVCSKCKPGTYFENNICVNCTLHSFESGCFMCQPGAQGGCLVCRPGFSQVENGTCVAQASSQTAQSNKTGVAAGMAEGLSAGAVKLAGNLGLLFLLELFFSK